jgi:hypothetical protein
MLVCLYPYFWLFNTLNPILIILAQCLALGVSVLPVGSNPVLFTESFPTKYRASGAGLTFQLQAFIGGLSAAVLLPVLLVTFGVLGAWPSMVVAQAALTIAAIVASFFVKETKGTTLE